MEEEYKIENWLIYYYRSNTSTYSNNSYEYPLMAIKCSNSQALSICENMERSNRINMNRCIGGPYQNLWGSDYKILSRKLEAGVFESYKEFEEHRKIKVEERLKELADTESYRYI